MKVLFIAPRFHTNLYYRIKALQKQGHQVKIVTLYQGKSEFYKDINCEVIGYSKLYNFLLKYLSKLKKNYLKSKFELRWGIPNSKALKRIIKEFNPDITLLKAYQDMLALSVLWLLKRYDKKAIILVQTSKGHIKGSRILLRLYLRILKFLNVTHFITPVKSTKEIFEDLGIKSCDYIPFVIEVTDFRKKYFRDKKINIISIGKFVRRKDQLLLLKAVNELKEKYSINLTFVGEKADKDYIKEIEDDIKQNNLKEGVNIKFNLDYKKTLEEYKKNDLFVLPSYNEPAAYSIVEAMANKLPIICSDECGTKCYIEKNGYVFRHKNVDDLMTKINLIMHNKKKLVKMGEKSFKLAQLKHSLNYFNKKFNEVLINKK